MPPAWLRSLGRLLGSGLRLDRTQSDPVVAGRNALGVVLPLAIGAWTVGTAAAGLPATIGALQTSFADRPGPYRLRLARMGLTAAAAALTSGLAVALSGTTAGSVALLAGLAFGAGLLLAAGPSATQVGIAATAAAIILGHQSERPGIAVHVALLVLAGGLGQAALAVAAWPLRRHGPERRALAGLYRALADVARQAPSPAAPPAVSDEVQAVRQVFYGYGHDHGPSVEAYRVLFDQAERIRREVLLVAGYAHRFERQEAAQAAAAMHRALAGVAVVCDEIAVALERARPVSQSVLDPVRADLARTRELLGAGVGAPAIAADSETGRTERAALTRLAGLSGQLRAAVVAAGVGGAEGAAPADDDQPGRPRLRAPLEVIRANLHRESPVLRHAIRLAVAVGGSDLIARLAGVPRGYWIALTVLVVMRPDFAGTFQRSILRILGTIVGLVVASELVHVVPGGQWYAVALIALFTFAFRYSGPANVAPSAFCLSGLVVVLLSLIGISPHDSVLPRAADTLVGGGIALVAVLVWPVWERGLVRQRLAELIGAYRRFLVAVDDPESDADRLRRERSAARLARTAALASVDRARAEPVPARAEVELAESVLANSHRLIHAVMNLDALRPTLRGIGATPRLDALLAAAVDALTVAETALRTGERPRRRPPLRPLQEELFAALRANPDRYGGPDVVDNLADASDRLANSVDTILDVLRDTSAGPGTSSADGTDVVPGPAGSSSVTDQAADQASARAGTEPPRPASGSG